MHFDGPDTDRQAVGNLLARVSSCDQMEHLALPWREAGVSIRRSAQISPSDGLPGAVSTGKGRLMGARHVKQVGCLARRELVAAQNDHAPVPQRLVQHGLVLEKVLHFFLLSNRLLTKP